MGSPGDGKAGSLPTARASLCNLARPNEQRHRIAGHLREARRRSGHLGRDVHRRAHPRPRLAGSRRRVAPLRRRVGGTAVRGTLARGRPAAPDATAGHRHRAARRDRHPRVQPVLSRRTRAPAGEPHVADHRAQSRRHDRGRVVAARRAHESAALVRRGRGTRRGLDRRVARRRARLGHGLGRRRRIADVRRRLLLGRVHADRPSRVARADATRRDDLRLALGHCDARGRGGAGPARTVSWPT